MTSRVKLLPVLLLFLSFLASWGHGTDTSLLYRVLGMAVYPGSFGISPLFSLIIIVLLVTIFVGLTYAVQMSENSRTACMSGLLLCIIGTGTIILLVETGIGLTTSDPTIRSIGFGPPLAIISQIWLAAIFIKNL